MAFDVNSDIKNLFQDSIFISTRPAGSSGALNSLFNGVGATLIEFPMIEVSASFLEQNDIDELKKIYHFDWVIFTSANGVKYFYHHMKQMGLSSIEAKIAVIGEKTNAALESAGKNADFVCQKSDGESFAVELNKIFENQFPKVLWPTGNLTPEKSQQNFERIADLSRINVYETSYTKTINSEVLKQISDNAYTMVLLYSPSALHNLYTLSKGFFDIKNLKVGCIGPTTHKACKAMGINALVTSVTASNQGMFEAVGDYLLAIKNTK